jgi:hypothetical protein
LTTSGFFFLSSAARRSTWCLDRAGTRYWLAIIAPTSQLTSRRASAECYTSRRRMQRRLSSPAKENRTAVFVGGLPAKNVLSDWEGEKRCGRWRWAVGVAAEVRCGARELPEKRTECCGRPHAPAPIARRTGSSGSCPRRRRCLRSPLSCASPRTASLLPRPPINPTRSSLVFVATRSTSATAGQQKPDLHQFSVPSTPSACTALTAHQ